MWMNFEGKCENCGAPVKLRYDVTMDLFAPKTRANLRPNGNVLVYRVTTDDMKEFITAKARMFCENVKLEVIPRYTENKRRSKYEHHHSYASLRIAFSEDVIDNNDKSWFAKIGESSDNVRIIKSVFDNMIRKYQYNLDDLKAWKDSYKHMDHLEERFGISSKYIDDIIMYATPKRITVPATREQWVFFSAACENVLADMMTVPKTNKLPGRILIQDIHPISKDNVEFIVYLYLNEVVMKENPHVRQILMGEEKGN